MIQRLARLETAAWYDRHIMQEHIARLERQLQSLPQTSPPSSPLTPAGLIKITVAICLPGAVLIATGSLEQARAALRMVLGH